MYCHKCGRQNNDGAKFCKFCGEKIINNYGQSDVSDEKTGELPKIDGFQNQNNMRGAYGGFDSRPMDGYYSEIKTDTDKSSKRTLVIFIVTIAAVVLVVLAIAAMYFFGGKNNDADNSSSAATIETQAVIAPTTTTQAPIDTSNSISIPSVIGFSYNDAVEKLYNANLQSSMTAEYSNSVPDNCIIRQSPAAGTEAKEGDMVSIVMSKGAFTTPDYDALGIPYSKRSSGSAILSQSSSSYLSDGDVSTLGIKALEIARNEIYARHGRRFDSSELQSYFNSKDWYIGTIQPGDFSESILNEYERYNVDFLMKKEDALRNPKPVVSSSSSEKEYSSPVFQNISSSSNLVSEKGTVYSPNNLRYDDNNCWAEGVSGDGEGEWIMLYGDEKQRVSGVKIVNGFTKSPSLYNANGKVKRMRFEFSDGTSYTADLVVRYNATSDNYKYYDYISFPTPVETTYIKMVIVEAASGDKYEDTCLSLIAPY